MGYYTNQYECREIWHFYSSAVVIRFIPYKEKVCCKEISFVQAARTVDNRGNYVATSDARRKTADHWSIDQSAGQKSPWYPYGNRGSVWPLLGSIGSSPDPYKEAVLKDTPLFFKTNVVFDFETVAACKEGMDKGRVYGSLTWGFDVDKDGKLTSHNPSARDNISGSFRSAMFMWNMQALGPSEQKNHPDQELLEINYCNRSMFMKDPANATVTTKEWEDIAREYWAAPPNSRSGFENLIP